MQVLLQHFGLTNSPAIFQNMMNNIFQDLIFARKVLIYLDNILIFTKTLEEHHHIVCQVLLILQKHKLYLKPKKCDFVQTEIEYLGLIISENQVHMDPVKTHRILDWPTPACKWDLQSFLGFINFYCCFIRDFATIAKPLSILTGNTTWSWTAEHQLAFDQLKASVMTAPVLTISTDDGPYHLEADSSGHALGAVLSHYQSNIWQFIVFLSKSLTPTEHNYQIYDHKLLVIMTALTEWCHFLMGAPTPFEIWTDHQNLEYFCKPQKLNHRQAHWVTDLANYHFMLHHHPGRTHVKADLLSRHAGHDKGENDNEGITLLKPEVFHRLEFSLDDCPFLDRIHQCSANRDQVVQQNLTSKEPDWT